MQCTEAVRLLMVAAVAQAAAHPHEGIAVPPIDEAPQADDACLACLCHVMGGGKCLMDADCGPGPTCGPFRISEPYWIDAGRPVQPGDDSKWPGAFLRCVEEPFCAVRTIQNYMTGTPRLRDCDRSGSITCRDLLRAHLHGKYVCNVTDDDSRFDDLEVCLLTTKKEARSMNLPDDNTEFTEEYTEEPHDPPSVEGWDSPLDMVEPNCRGQPPKTCENRTV